MMRALIVVDVQYDFLPGGALAVPEGDAVINAINQAMGDYPLVIATRDWHPANHKSFASQHPGNNVGDVVDLHGLRQILWPDHCIQGTRGAELSDDLRHERISRVIDKGQDPEVDNYSGFFANGHRHKTDLDDCLKVQNVTGVDVCGLALDYCVRATALDAAALGYATRLLCHATLGVELNEGDCQRALAEMRAARVDIVDEKAA